MKREATNNLPAVQGGSFDLAVGGMEFNPELLAEVKAEDFGGYEPSRSSLPIVSIRQKEVKDERGKTVTEAGGFRIYDPVTAPTGIAFSDQQKLTLTFLIEHPTRTYWAEGNLGNPDCRAADGKSGVGKPGGDCTKCPMSQWNGSDRPACTFNAHVLSHDHASGMCYVVRFGRSGLKPWNNFKELVKRMAKGQIPVHALIIEMTTQFMTDPAPHYIPVLTPIGQVDLNQFRLFKKFRQEFVDVLKRTSVVDVADDDHPIHDTTAETVTPIHEAGSDGNIPY